MSHSDNQSRYRIFLRAIDLLVRKQFQKRRTPALRSECGHVVGNSRNRRPVSLQNWRVLYARMSSGKLLVPRRDHASHIVETYNPDRPIRHDISVIVRRRHRLRLIFWQIRIHKTSMASVLSRPGYRHAQTSKEYELRATAPSGQWGQNCTRTRSHKNR